MKLISAVLLLLPGVFSYAQDTIQSRDLSEVVITGQYKPQSVRNSVYQVRVLSKEVIQKQGATNLKDVLNNVLNIRFTQDLATGGSSISMLGLAGQNVKILIDGLPVIGRQGASNEIDINQIDINSIERIEIVEGPMSVIYGADALAGVINIITRKASSKKLSVNARIHEESAGNEYGIQQGIHNQHAGLRWKNKSWELGGSLGKNYFGGWKDTANERELVWHKKDQLVANGFIAYKKENWSLNYRFDGLDEIITNPGNFINDYPAAADTLANDQEYLTKRIMHQVQGSYFVNGNLSLQSQLAYTDYSRQVFSTNVSKKTGTRSLSTAPGSQSLVDFHGFTFRTLALYKLSSVLSFQPGIDIQLEEGKGERLKEGNNRVSDYSFFITSEFTPSSKISVRPGLRFTKNSVYQAPPVIPSINTKFALNSRFDLRLAYARGFRSPSIRELYFSFFDANHQILGNPDLKAETSNSFTGSLSWKPRIKMGVSFSASLGAFYNNVENLIDYGVSANDPNVFIYVNVAKYKTRGLNVATEFKRKNLSISMGAAYTGYYNNYSEDNKSLASFQWSPEINSIIAYSFPNLGLDLNLFYKFTGKKPAYISKDQEIVLTELEAYHMADLSLNKKLFKNILLNTGIRNLFDVDRVNSTIASNGVHSSNGSRNIACGRSVFAGLIFNWDKK